MKQLGPLLLPPPPDGMLKHHGVCAPNSMLPVRFIVHLGEERQCAWSKVSCQRKRHSNEESNLASNQRPSDLMTKSPALKIRRANHFTMRFVFVCILKWIKSVTVSKSKTSDLESQSSTHFRNTYFFLSSFCSLSWKIKKDT